MLETMSSMFIVKCTIPMEPKVVPLSVFTHSDFLTLSTLSKIFVTSWYEIEEHVAPVSNRVMTESQS